MKNTANVFKNILPLLGSGKGTIPLAALLLLSFSGAARAQGTAFSYQGRLNDGSNPANGIYDLRFTIYDSTNSPGNIIAGPLTNSATGVTNGLFSLTLDFGAGIFTGAGRWLQLDVRTNGGGAFTMLLPRQPLLPMPYAIMANSASNLLGTLPVAQLIGAVGNAQLANSSITVNAGTGLSGGGTVALGGSTTLNNVGVLSVTGNADITASTVNGAVTLGDTATSANTPSTIVKRDGSGNFSAASISVDGNLSLPFTTANYGTIYAGGHRLVHSYGGDNFFAGADAGNLTMIGRENTGVGVDALISNWSGSNNTANGYCALVFNTSGSCNTADGDQALYWNTSGSDNTANGYQSLGNNSSGNKNTAIGSSSLLSNTHGSNNTACGARALLQNTTGFGNTAVGASALLMNPGGTNNTACGAGALSTTVGSGNIALGNGVGSRLLAGNNNIYIGSPGPSLPSAENNTIRIGSTQNATWLAGINGNAIYTGGINVLMDPGDLRLGYSGLSSQRFKEGIHGMDSASDVLYALRPVTFRYKEDPKGNRQFGLVAEEVEKVDPDLVMHDKQGDPYGVRYEVVNAMLLNEFLKEHRKVEEQAGQIGKQHTEIQDLKSRLKRLEQLFNAQNGGGQ